MRGGNLTAKRQRFVEEYLIDRNGAAAYKRAGYKATGNSAEVNAARLLRNAQVRAAVKAGEKVRLQKLKLTRRMIIDGLLSETKKGNGSSQSARVRAWELLGKHRGMFVDRHEHSGKGGKAIPITFVEFADGSEAEAPGGSGQGP